MPSSRLRTMELGFRSRCGGRSSMPSRATNLRERARALDRERDRSRPRGDNSIPEQQCCRQERNDLPRFVAHSMLGPHGLARGVIRCGYRQKDANLRSVIFHALPAFDLNPTSVAFNKLRWSWMYSGQRLCDLMSDLSAHPVERASLERLRARSTRGPAHVAVNPIFGSPQPG
jgi:hypothetical protein